MTARTRLDRVLDRIATVMERRATPRHAIAAVLVTVLVTSGTLAVIASWPAGAGSGPGPEAAQPPAPTAGTEPESRAPPRPVAAAPLLSPPPPTVPTDGFVGWAVLDLRTGAVTGSDNLAETSTTASMIKAWIAADYLRRTAENGDEPSQARLDQLTQVIRDSNNEHAETIFRELGRHESIERLISICALTDSRAVRNFWSNTQLSPRDTARMGACLADGRAAGPEWTDWLLDEMRAVRGNGDFGIRHALPPGERSAVAIKNGWIIRDESGEWHVNCLAIGDGWTMGVQTRYPASRGLAYGAEICRSLAAEHLP